MDDAVLACGFKQGHHDLDCGACFAARSTVFLAAFQPRDQFAHGRGIGLAADSAMGLRNIHLFPSFAPCSEQANRVLGDIHHALCAANLKMPRVFPWSIQIRLDQSLRAIFKCDQAHARILDWRIALKPVGLPLDRAHHPLGFGIVQHKANAIDGMRRPVDQALRDLPLHHHRIADHFVAHQHPRPFPTGGKATLVADHQFRAVLLARLQHAVRLAQADGHGLFANNARHPAICRAYRAIGMEQMPRTNAGDIEVFSRHHFVQRGVRVGNAKFLAKLRPRHGMGIGDGHHFRIGNAQIPIGVTACN